MTNCILWGERGLDDGYPDCGYYLASLYADDTDEYSRYISRGARGGSPICCYLMVFRFYNSRIGFTGNYTSARSYARKALEGGIEEAQELLDRIDEDERHWEYMKMVAEAEQEERFRQQEERDRRESAEYWQKELSFLSSLNDPFTAIDSTGRSLTVDPGTATATDGTNTYGVSEDTLKNLRVQRMRNRNDGD